MLACSFRSVSRSRLRCLWTSLWLTPRVLFVRLLFKRARNASYLFRGLFRSCSAKSFASAMAWRIMAPRVVSCRGLLASTRISSRDAKCPSNCPGLGMLPKVLEKGRFGAMLITVQERMWYDSEGSPNVPERLCCLHADKRTIEDTEAYLYVARKQVLRPNSAAHVEFRHLW